MIWIVVLIVICCMFMVCVICGSGLLVWVCVFEIFFGCVFGMFCVVVVGSGVE